MIVTCPACDTRYNVPEERLGATGRTIQCAKCQYSWFQPPSELPTKKEGAEEAPAAPIAPKNTTSTPDDVVTRNVADDNSNENNMMMALPKPLVIGAGAGLILLMGLMVGLLVMNPFAHKGPAAYRALDTYEGERPPTSLSGMALTDVTRKVLSHGDVAVLLFTGNVTNTGNLPLDIPEIRVQLLDKRGVELDFWPAQVEMAELAPGESTSWSARFLNPDLSLISEYKVFFHEE